MANLIYGGFKKGMGEGLFDLRTDTLRCALLTGAYAPDPGHAAFGDVAASEVAGAGYAPGGQTLGGVVWRLSGAAAMLDADDPSWAEATITARYALLYVAKSAGGLTDPLVCLLDFGSDKGVSGGTFRVAFDAAGILTLG